MLRIRATNLVPPDVDIVGFQKKNRVPPLVALVHQVAGGLVFRLDVFQRIHQVSDFHGGDFLYWPQAQAALFTSI
jgi:hypothetical protein